MSPKRAIVLMIIIVACGTTSFFRARMVAMAARQKQQKMTTGWLDEMPLRVVELEKNFADESDELTKALAEQQQALASTLDDPCSTNEAILGEVENVIYVHERLMKRVGRHVVELRSKLPATQQDYLMELCAEVVRGSMRGLGGQGGNRSRGDMARGGAGRGRGRGLQGDGYGQRQRGRGRLANKLRLTEEQVKAVQEKDPQFEADSLRLAEALIAEMAKLLSLFENRSSSDEQLLQQIDKLVACRSRIERRIAEHVLVLRAYLDVEQQKWLIGLCCRRRGQARPPAARVSGRVQNNPLQCERCTKAKGFSILANRKHHIYSL